LGPDHVDTAAALHQLARASYQLDELAAAEAAYTRALTIRRARLGAEHADTRNTMSGLADVFTDALRFDAAESLLREVIALDRKVSDQGRNAASHLRALARLYLRTSDYFRAAQVNSANLSERILRWGSDSRKQAFLETLREDLNTRISFSLAASRSDGGTMGLLDLLLLLGRLRPDRQLASLACLSGNYPGQGGRIHPRDSQGEREATAHRAIPPEIRSAQRR
jgi:tetratricopeptide (TPR) repeat protein